MLFDFMLSAFMLSVLMHKFILLSVFILSVFIQSAIILSALRLNIVTLSVVMLNVMVPCGFPAYQVLSKLLAKMVFHLKNGPSNRFMAQFEFKDQFYKQFTAVSRVKEYFLNILQL